MREWFSAKELAGMPGLPGSPQGINKKGDREDWERKLRAGSEKAWIYHRSSLPEATRTYISRQSMQAAADEASKSPEFAEYAETELLESIPGVKTAEMLLEEDNERMRVCARNLIEFGRIPAGQRRKKKAKARRWVLVALGNFIRKHQCTRTAAYKGFASEIARGEFTLPDWVEKEMPTYRGERSLSSATLANWDKAYYEKGMMGLVDHLGGRKGQSIIETCEPLFRLVVGAMIQAPQITGKAMIEFINASNAKLATTGAPALPVPHQRNYEKFRNRWIAANAQVWTMVINPDMWKNKYMSAAGSHNENITSLNQLWELDSTPADWMLKDGRHSVVGVIDMFSRRLKYFVSKTSKSTAVCQVTRRAIMDWGVCDGVRTDNGQDYVSDQYEIVLEGLEIQHFICIPYASEEKGTIERSMRTLSHGILNLLPGFIGHNVAERKQIEARKSFADRLMTPGELVEVDMNAADLQQHLDDWCEHYYGNDKHASLGMSPNEKARSWRGGVRRISDERALDMLLAEVAGTRTIGKKGVRFENHTYFNEGIGQYVGKRALIKYDERDIGRLYAYVEEQFIGVLLCYDILGISRQEAASAVKAKQKKLVSAQAAKYRAYSKEIKTNMAETVMDYRIAESENVVALPAASTEYTTTGLTEAARAVAGDSGEADPAINSTPLNKEEQAVADQINTDAAEETSPLALFGVDPARDFALWKRLDARMQQGETLMGREHDIWTHYQKSDEFIALVEMEEAFAAESGS